MTTRLNPNSVELGSLSTPARDALPTPVATGTLIYNTDDNQLQVWDGSQWIGGLTTPLTATGGTTSTVSRPGFVVHTFTGNGTFSVTAGSGTAEYLLVGGGGGGGRNGFPDPNGRYGAGGGAGGIVYGTWDVSPGTYPVTVGGGGAALAGGVYPGTGSDYPGRVGGTTTLTGAPVSSAGGGGGGPGHYGPEAAGQGTDQRPGGVSMGGGQNQSILPSGTYGPGAYTGATGGTNDSTSPPAGWGNEGGPFSQAPNPAWGGAGGGGAGGAGSNGSGSAGGSGGAGLTYGVSGNPTIFAGGGGGGPNGNGGSGVGGFGARTNGAAPSGNPNTGSGGGGNCYSRGSSAGGNGGSGIVIIAYPS